MNRQAQRPSPIALPGMPPQNNIINVAAPLTDTQLLYMLAGQIYGSGILKTPQEAVQSAAEIAAWATVAMKDKAVNQLIQQIEAQLAKSRDKSESPDGP